MRKPKKRQKGDPDEEESHFALEDHTKRVVLGIVSAVATIFFVLAAIGRAGVAGEAFYNTFTYLLGSGYMLLPVLGFVVSYLLFSSQEVRFSPLQGISACLFLLAGFGFFDITLQSGGIVGHSVAFPLLALFDVYVSTVGLSALLIISLLVLTNSTAFLSSIGTLVRALRARTKAGQKDQVSTGESTPEQQVPHTEEPAPQNREQEKSRTAALPAEEKRNTLSPREQREESMPAERRTPESMENTALADEVVWANTYAPPPLDLLKKDYGKPSYGDIKANTNIIKRTLMNFGIDVEMSEVSVGPSITRYSLKPAEGTKLSRIVSLQDNLALALAAHPVRIEAPIPGKSLVGIEIPNATKSIVGAATLLGAEEFLSSDKPLLIALGRDISGKAHYANLARMPHLLLAGATGSGKSVVVHNLITSLLYKNSPENLKLIMIDAKRVELTLYNNIPHLQFQVITSPKDAILALHWAAGEMSRRYDILETEQVRDIESYNRNIYLPALKKAQEEAEHEEYRTRMTAVPPRMPYIVIVIDELAQIMQAQPRELEAAIVRIAQMSRAVGIHLILSTQRPSVDIITGLIKANIPSRIALQVTSQIDSRTILDASGAEKLLGAGDMLYLSGEMSKPVRLQSALVSEGEVKSIVSYLLDTYQGPPPPDINTFVNSENNAVFFDALKSTALSEPSEDPFYEEARLFIIQARKASTSLLQRKFRIGYSRAARLIDMLEERGIVGKGDGQRPREILVDADQGTNPSDTRDEDDNDTEEEFG